MNCRQGSPSKRCPTSARLPDADPVKEKRDIMDLGFIGLGIMGRPMAGHLQAAGHKLFLNTRSGVPKEMVERGGVACRSPREVAEKSDIVFTMVPDTPDVEKVLFATDGVASGLSKGKIVVDMSSISPLATKEFARRIEEIGCF